MRIVLDTNVLVSGLLQPHGPPGTIVRLVASGAIGLCLDERLLDEYRAVLGRTAFGFDPDDVSALLEQVRKAGLAVTAHPLPRRLPDPDDEPFLEVALAAPANCLVTGNRRHFPASLRQGMAVLTPAEFIDRLLREQG